MLDALLKKIFGTKHERDVKRAACPWCRPINALEASVQALDDAALRAKTDELRQRAPRPASPLDDLLPEAFAVGREAARRTMGMRHFDVQLIGGMVLHEGPSPRWRPARARRSSRRCPPTSTRSPGGACTSSPSTTTWPSATPQWMGPIYHALGLSVGVIQHEASFLYDPAYVTSDIRLTSLRPCTRQEAYGPTSPTAPTTSSASTTCATTWLHPRGAGAARADTTPSSTRSTPS